MTSSQMRAALLTGMQNLTLGSFQVSTELPWDAAGTALYEKNPKVFYVSEPDVEESQVFAVMNGDTFVDRTTTIQVYVQVDAKQQPTNYDDLMDAVQNLRLLSTLTAIRTRECDVVTTFEADAMITEFEFRFTELKIN